MKSILSNVSRQCNTEETDQNCEESQFPWKSSVQFFTTKDSIFFLAAGTFILTLVGKAAAVSLSSVEVGFQSTLHEITQC